MDELWRAYRHAERRADRCREVGDLTGLAIAEGQAAHWLAEWVSAEARAANAKPFPIGRTARPVSIA